MSRALLMMLLIGWTTAVGAESKIPQSRAEISLGFAPLVKQAAPAVVNIYARHVVQAQTSPFMDDPFFKDFFRGFGTPRPRVQNSLGSGVILSADGIVVSNYHVVGQATDIRVVLNDRREFSARVLLGDKVSDLAILQLEGAEALPNLNLRNSDLVEVGELVLAIGNPFGVGQTVSSGIVSGLARSGAAVGNERSYFIQTDAPINPGNSGGALVDVNGQVIGINTAILSRSGGSNGIGFAIPANLVAAFVEQARAGNTTFQRPWAGMAGQPVDADLAETLGLDLPVGLVISDLHPDSPFVAAGFAVGDVITHVDGHEVNSPQEMVFRMTVVGLEAKVRVTRIRDGVAKNVTVDMMQAPDMPPSEETVLDAHTLVPGLRVARVNPAIIAQYGLPLSMQGVLVLDPGNVGGRIGIRPRDILVAVNKTKIKRSGDVVQAFTDPGRRVTVDLLRGGQQVRLRFRL